MKLKFCETCKKYTLNNNCSCKRTTKKTKEPTYKYKPNLIK